MKIMEIFSKNVSEIHCAFIIIWKQSSLLPEIFVLIEVSAEAGLAKHWAWRNKQQKEREKMWFIIVIFSVLLGELMGSGRSLPNINHEASM